MARSLVQILHIGKPSPPLPWRPLLLLWSHRLRTRRALARLEPHQLRDIGITAADQARECAKGFWEA
jgi:uncharacterized protein YjiS (DUF1127 family)